MESYYVRLNQARSKAFAISKIQFKATIVVSLPSSWDIYTEPYIGESMDDTQDYWKRMSSKAFIGDIIEHYKTLKERMAGGNKSDHVLFGQACPGQHFVD